MRCKRLQNDYKMNLINQIYKRQQRQWDVEKANTTTATRTLKQSVKLRDDVMETVLCGRKLQEPVGMETRYKEFLHDERNKKRMQMMQS